MTVQSVEARAQAVAEARGSAGVTEAALREECRAAYAAGVPLAAVARAAGVTRTTMYHWLRD